MSPADAATLDATEVLGRSRMFGGLAADVLAELAGGTQLVPIASGRVLFERGAPSDCMYIVATGRLRAVLPDGQVAGDIGQLEPIGEIGLLSGEPRVAAVHAIRDSLLVRIPAERLHALIGKHPQALLQMTRVVIARLRENQRTQHLASARSVRSFAVVPASAEAGPGAALVARALAEEFARHAPSLLIDGARVDAELGAGAAHLAAEVGPQHGRLVEYLNRVETDHRHVVYLADPDPDAWARRCMRQADRILLVAPARSPPVATAMVHELKTCGARAPVDVVLIRPEGADCGNVLGWRAQAQARAHYFVRPGHAEDLQSLARQLTGRGVGLVLGGGGARGFAHIGLVRALRELAIPVDLVGGSSMGAFFAALIACGYDHHEMLHLARETFVSHNYLNDYLFPSIALIRGRKFVRRLHEIFEDRRIEALRRPFFCVSTNLTRGAVVVHDQGPLHMWVATSMSVPGVAPPIAYRGELLADGAVINSLPTDVMQSLERGPIIASDVSTEGGIAAPGIEGPDPEAVFRKGANGERPSLFSIVFRTATLTSESGVAQRAARADLYLRMPVTGIALFDWKKFDEVGERGYRYALERLGPVREQLLRG